MGRDVNSREDSMGIGARAQRTRRTHTRLSQAALALSAAGAMAALAPAAASAGHNARSARTMSISESATLRLHDHHGVLLKEQGIAKGTLVGPLYLQLRLTSTRSVSVQVQVYPSGGGSLSGSAIASYRVVGSYAAFSGTLRITSGSGRYAKSRGSALSFSGTIKRANDLTSVRVSGRLSL